MLDPNFCRDDRINILTPIAKNFLATKDLLRAPLNYKGCWMCNAVTHPLDTGCKLARFEILVKSHTQKNVREANKQYEYFISSKLLITTY